MVKKTETPEVEFFQKCFKLYNAWGDAKLLKTKAKADMQQVKNEIARLGLTLKFIKKMGNNLPL